jgi:hypothetical protein
VCACVSVLAGRSQVMYNAYDAPVMYAHAYSAFFIVFLLIALFGLANVVVPILYNEFRGHRRELSLSMYGWCCMCGAAVWWLCVYVCVWGGVLCARVFVVRVARACICLIVGVSGGLPFACCGPGIASLLHIVRSLVPVRVCGVRVFCVFLYQKCGGSTLCVCAHYRVVHACGAGMSHVGTPSWPPSRCGACTRAPLRGIFAAKLRTRNRTAWRRVLLADAGHGWHGPHLDGAILRAHPTAAARDGGWCVRRRRWLPDAVRSVHVNHLLGVSALAQIRWRTFRASWRLSCARCTGQCGSSGAQCRRKAAIVSAQACARSRACARGAKTTWRSCWERR